MEFCLGHGNCKFFAKCCHIVTYKVLSYFCICYILFGYFYHVASKCYRISTFVTYFLLTLQKHIYWLMIICNIYVGRMSILFFSLGRFPRKTIHFFIITNHLIKLSMWNLRVDVFNRVASHVLTCHAYFSFYLIDFRLTESL